jgi:hypothetical protein
VEVYACPFDAPHLRLPLLFEKQKSGYDQTFIGFLEKNFSFYIQKGIPLQILDVGAGDALFLSRFKQVMKDNKIETKLYGIDPKFSRHHIEGGESEGIMLKLYYLKGFAAMASEKNKYNIIFINAPRFMLTSECDGYLKDLSNLLSEDGFIFLRHDTGHWGYVFDKRIAETIRDFYSDEWHMEVLKQEMPDLPMGYYNKLLPPLIISKRIKPDGNAVKPAARAACESI